MPIYNFNGSDLIVVGDATVDGTGVELTENLGNETGAAWLPDQISLESDFTFETDVNLGTNDGGADGIAFVIQNDPNGTSTIGDTTVGGPLGASGIINAIAVEIDTWDNGGTQENPPGPEEDHIAIYASPGANQAVDLFDASHKVDGPTPSAIGNVEDGADRTFLIEWDASTLTLTVSLDGVVETSHQFTQAEIDALYPDGLAYIGMTGATGGATNVQGFGPVELDGDYICFEETASIMTENGYVPVSELKVGDLVKTEDNGFQVIRWIGSSTVNGTGKNAPIKISAGILGCIDDLYVSPLHRIEISQPELELVFDVRDVLVPAKFLLNGSTITRCPRGSVTYYHLLFDDHQIIWANGVKCESLHIGKTAIGFMAEESQEEIMEIFPTLAQEDFTLGPLARLSLTKSEASLLSVN